jgi:polysaccharide biosynthesis/export protein
MWNQFKNKGWRHMTWITSRRLNLMRLVVFVAMPVIVCAQTVPASTNKSAAAIAGNASEAVSHEPVPSDGYIIGSDDVLAINVWQEPDLSRTVPVRLDGKITLPLVGDIGASGNTPKQLQATIEQSLSKYISKPAVTVIIQEAKSHKFNIVGAVQKPGTYLLTSPMTVLDAIALASGFRDWAKVKDIYVLRTSTNGAHLKLPFNYKKVIKGDARAQNIQLQTGDTVVVP